VSKNKTLKRFESTAEEHPFWFLGGALGAGLLLGRVAPQLIGGLLRLSGGLAWKFVVLPRLAETLSSTIESNLGNRRGSVSLPLDKKRALEMFGLMSRPSTAGRAFSSAGLLATGMVAGAGLGLAFAPRAGTELRRELKKRLHLDGHDRPEAVMDEVTGSSR
jgi:hypothetical protein